MRKFLLLALIAILALVGCDKEENVHSEEVKNAISDLEVLVDKAERIHPDLYKYVSEEDFKKAVEDAKKQFKTGDQVEFYILVAPIFASINDGTTVLEPLGDYFNHQITQGDHFFPYQIDVDDGKLFLESSFIGETEIPMGAEILSINNRNFEEIYGEMIKYFSGVTVAGKESGLIKEFHRLFYVLYGDFKTFDIEYQFEGSTNKVSIAGANAENIVVQPLPEVKTHSYEEVKEGVGLISIYKFDGFSTFKRFMEATAKKIEENPVDVLVLDIRDNIGGNTEYSKYLMSFITDQPFKIYGEIQAKISDEALTTDNYMKDNYSDKVGEIVTAEFNDESRPYEEVIPFEGDVYVLTGKDTFGTASEFAALVKDYGVGTLIGKETGTNPSGFKSVYLAMGPTSNTRLAIPYQYFSRPSGEDTKKGVVPDVTVEGDALEYILDNH